MKKISSVLFLIVFIIGVLFFLEKSLTFVKADVGAPVTITATYNSSTGQLNASGSYAWEECELGEETNILGYALFINGGTPAINDSNALDGAGMHLANSGNPCTTTPDNWSDNGHVLSSTPINVCVVIYDVRADDSADPGGTHSTIGAGDNHNIDNSWDRLEDDDSHQSYREGACTTPEVITPTSTPEPTATPTPQPASPSCGSDEHLDLSGTKCLKWELGGPPPPPPVTGQVLGASTLAGTGTFEDGVFSLIFMLGCLVTSLGIRKIATAQV